MKKSILLLVSFYLWAGSALWGQSAFQQVYESLPEGFSEGIFTSDIKAVPLEHPRPFFSFTPVGKMDLYHPDLFRLEVRFGTEEGTFTPWETIGISHDLEEVHASERAASQNTETFSYLGEMQLIDSSYHSYQYRVTLNTPVEWLRFDFFSPGEVAPPAPRPAADTGCACPLPSFVNRTGWNCPDGQSPSCVSPIYYPVTHLIVHHSAGVSSSNDWPAVVLAIWNLHVNTNGWCDIGYNWLIDGNGVVYEGRGGGDNVQGAHFCGKNSATMGVCMLGNFELGNPAPDAVQSLSHLLAWKACDSELDPLDTTFHVSSQVMLPVVSGHRDGCATACPGQFLYARLPDLRQEVTGLLDSCQVVTEMEAPLSEGSFKVYPNPSDGTFFLEFSSLLPGQGLWELFSLSGKRILKEEIRVSTGVNRFKIQTPAGLTQGLYGMRWETPNGSGWEKLIIR